MAAQHLPLQTVLTKLSQGPTLCAVWVGIYRPLGYVLKVERGPWERA